MFRDYKHAGLPLPGKADLKFEIPEEARCYEGMFGGTKYRINIIEWLNGRREYAVTLSGYSIEGELKDSILARFKELEIWPE